MNIKDLQGQHVCILGFGREGQSVLRAIRTHAPGATVTIADQNENLVLEDNQVTKQLGSNWLQDLQTFDVIITSPGVPPFAELQAVEERITNATQIFMDTIASTGGTIIGVTGTKGKSTTCNILTAILKEAGKKVHMVGNIGVPVLDFVDHSGPDVFFVQEMSSYQLLYTHSSPPIAVVTSFFPDHLDYHGSEKAYLAAKKNIAKHQQQQDHIFYATNTAGAKSIAQESAGTIHPYSAEDAPVTADQTPLLGTHNLCNIAGAWLVASHLGVSKDVAIRAIQQCKGLPHRLEHIGIHHGIQWVDDAISTTPESTIAALEALGPTVQTLICGGQDRGYVFTELGNAIDNSNIETVILFPDSGEKIRNTIRSKSINFIAACDMQQAVSMAKEVTQPGKICVLSTASPSYNMFKNFEAKGDEFQEAIMRNTQ